MTSAIPTPAQIEPIVSVLGVDGAIAFLLEFGGAELYLSQNPQSNGELVQFLGRDKAIALARAAQHLPARVPTQKPWIAKVLRSKGLPTARIARKLHVSDVFVRKHVRAAGIEPLPSQKQLRLPL